MDTPKNVTIRLDSDLLDKAQAHAKKAYGISFNGLIRMLLIKELGKEEAPK